MNREEIKQILPHREPMLLLDESERNGDTVYSKYTIRENEFFTTGHFPGYPVVPGVILCEIMAQSACVLLNGTIGEDKLPVYAGLDKVKFKSPVRPGDTFETKCRITRSMGPFFFGEGEGYVDGRLCISASFSFCITDKEMVCSPRS